MRRATLISLFSEALIWSLQQLHLKMKVCQSVNCALANKFDCLNWKVSPRIHWMAKGMLNCENSSETAGYCCRERRSLDVSAKYKSRSVHGALTAAVLSGTPIACATWPHSLSHLKPQPICAKRTSTLLIALFSHRCLTLRQSRSCNNQISSVKRSTEA